MNGGIWRPDNDAKLAQRIMRLSIPLSLLWACNAVALTIEGSSGGDKWVSEKCLTFLHQQRLAICRQNSDCAQPVSQRRSPTTRLCRPGSVDQLH